MEWEDVPDLPYDFGAARLQEQGCSSWLRSLFLHGRTRDDFGPAVSSRVADLCLLARVTYFSPFLPSPCKGCFFLNHTAQHQRGMTEAVKSRDEYYRCARNGASIVIDVSSLARRAFAAVQG